MINRYCSECGFDFEQEEAKCVVCSRIFNGVDCNVAFCVTTRNNNLHFCSEDCKKRFVYGIKKAKELAGVEQK